MEITKKLLYGGMQERLKRREINRYNDNKLKCKDTKKVGTFSIMSSSDEEDFDIIRKIRSSRGYI